MKIYKVGGAVRDLLRHKTPHDTDYVVLGSTFDDMIAHGFIPVWQMVFIHPETKEEYALARTETKTGNGHTDFICSPTSSLEEDLARRDFTVNAMAMDEKGNIIDPFNGRKDLENKILRVVTPSAFPEDPLRVLRGARFAAELDFKIDEKSKTLMTDMVTQGALSHLTKERIWREIERALKSENPDIFFRILLETEAFSVLFPDLKNYPETHLSRLKNLTSDEQRWAAFLLPFRHNMSLIRQTHERLKTPRRFQTKVENLFDIINRPILVDKEEFDFVFQKTRFKNFTVLDALFRESIPLSDCPNRIRNRREKAFRIFSTLSPVNITDFPQLKGLTGKEFGNMLNEVLFEKYQSSTKGK